MDVVGPIYEWYHERVDEYHYPKLSDFEATVARIREVSERLEPGLLSTLPDGPPHFVDPSVPRSVRPRPKRRPKPKSKKGRKKR